MKRIVILGGKESGTGAALLAKQQGYEVFLSDFGEIQNNYKNDLVQKGIPFEEGKHTESLILNADLIVKSPGIPQKSPLIQKIKTQNIPVVSEIEFAARHTTKKIIAITGSNGKTTTTSLIYHMMSNANLKVGLGGNIGNSFAKLVLNDNDYDYYILEISSFQLDDIAQFKPYIAILLNITPDHLDEYNYDLNQYAQAKFKITQNQTQDNYFIYNADDNLIQSFVENQHTKAKTIGFSLNQPNQPAYANHDLLTIKYPDLFQMTIQELALIGKHNVSNSLAAAVNGNILGVRKEIIQQSLMDFDAVEHRLEPVLSIHGIQFINDSKATNVNSVFYALESINTPIVWIVGGVDKGNDYNELLPFVKKKVHAIVCLGKDNQQIIQAFGNVVDTIAETDNMQDAVRSSYMLGKKGDTVLLSPACASFDLFKNYEDRGIQFKQEVKQL